VINFCCVLYGEKYGTDYVQNLYNMVKRHLTVEHKFYAFSDNVRLKKLVKGDIIVKEFPLYDMQGWWNKMQLFHPDNGLSGLNLYMDLDVVILKNINCFAQFSNKSSFNITSDFNGRKIWYNSSLMKWDSETMKPIIWDEFIKKRSHYYRLQGDQNAITELLRQNKKFHHENVETFPNDWTNSYKWFDRVDPRFSKNLWTFEQKPDSKVAVFHGYPKPHQSEEEWVKNNWK